MKYIKAAAAAILLALALTACGGSDEKQTEEAVAEAINEAFSEWDVENYVPCEEFLERMPVPPEETSCGNASKGTIEIGLTLDCEDGRTFIWTDSVMGYAGEPGVPNNSAPDYPERAAMQKECAGLDW